MSVLSAFDVFGESAFLSAEMDNAHRTRIATVVTESDPTQLLKLTRVAFDALVESGKLAGTDEKNVLGRVRTMNVQRVRSNKSAMAAAAKKSRSEDFSLRAREEEGQTLAPPPPLGLPPSPSSGQGGVSL